MHCRELDATVVSVRRQVHEYVERQGFDLVGDVLGGVDACTVNSTLISTLMSTVKSTVKRNGGRRRKEGWKCYGVCTCGSTLTQAA